MITKERNNEITQARPAGTRRYEVTFTDGKSATVLDMEARPRAEAMAGIRSIFPANYVATLEAL
jgi:hypothetical protein